MISAARICLVVMACCSIACGTSEPDSEPEPAPTPGAPSSAIEWPASPDGLAADVDACVSEYRAMAVAGFPSRSEGQAFPAWYAGPFQTWTQGYNTLRERCDTVFHALDVESPAAQVLLAAQSYLHERVGHEAEVYDEAPQMFIMSRYWTLGAACTYQTCQAGTDQAWAGFCRGRAALLPPCPPPEPPPEPETP